MTPIFAPTLFNKRFCKVEVFPAPKNPASNVTGIFAAVFLSEEDMSFDDVEIVFFEKSLEVDESEEE